MLADFVKRSYQSGSSSRQPTISKNILSHMVKLGNNLILLTLDNAYLISNYTPNCEVISYTIFLFVALKIFRNNSTTVKLSEFDCNLG